MDVIMLLRIQFERHTEGMKMAVEDYHKEYKNSYIYLARYNYENGNLKHSEYIDECYVYNNDTNKMELCTIPNP